MSTLINKIKEKKLVLNCILFLVVILCMPLFEVMIKVLFSYGTYFGTFARYIFEGKICLGF